MARRGGRLDRRPSAVHVETVAPSHLRIVHLSDLHVGFRSSAMAELDRLLDRVAAEQPDLILISGDLAHVGRHQAEVLERLARLAAPIVCCPGNHDYRQWPQYIRRFGPPDHRVDWGGWSFLSLDSGHGCDRLTNRQIDWLEHQLTTVEGPRTIVQLHHPPIGEASLGDHRERLLAALEQHRVPLLLCGHWHHPRRIDGWSRSDGRIASRPTILVAPTAGGSVRHRAPSGDDSRRGFRLIEISASGWRSWLCFVGEPGRRVE